MAKLSRAIRNEKSALAERRQNILELAVMGISYAKIGRRFGIPESTARSIVLHEVERSPVPTAQQRRKMNALRLNKIWLYVFTLMLRGDPAMKVRWIPVLLQIAEREERLCDLDARESKLESIDPRNFQIPLAVLRFWYKEDLQQREISARSRPQGQQSTDAMARPEPSKELEEALDRMGPIEIQELRRLRRDADSTET